MRSSDRQIPAQHHVASELVSDHGAAKQAEPTDPMDLVGAVVPGGDLDQFARCFIEEFAGMGFDGEEILALFRQPEYVGLHPIYQIKGEESVRRMIAEVLDDCGVFRVTEVAAEPARGAKKLFQIEEPTRASEKVFRLQRPCQADEDERQ